MRREFERLRRRPGTAFERSKVTPSDVALRPQAFVAAVSGELGPEFCRSLGLEDQLGLIVAYLAEEVPNQISLRKLDLALTYGETDPPLQQHGAEELKSYQSGLRGELSRAASGANNDVAEFASWLVRKNMGISDLFKQKLSASNPEIPVAQFTAALKAVGYVPKDMDKLVEGLDLTGKRQAISVGKLKDQLKQAGAKSKPTAEGARARLGRFDAKVQAYLQRISDYLKKESLSSADLHHRLDADGDGRVDKREFVTRMRELAVPGLLPQDLGLVFDSLDVNDDGALSLSEFALYLEGAQLNRAERVKRMDPEMLRSMREEIRTLFDSFDADGDGQITADEIYRTLQSFGIKKTIDQCSEMIRSAGGPHAASLDRVSFGEMMLPLMQGELYG